MKNIFLLTIGAALFLVTSCRQVNQELVGNMEAELVKMKQVMPDLDSFSQQSAALLKTMETAPMGFQNNPEYRLGELITKARAINDRSIVVKTMCQDVTTRLDSLIQGYSDGNITEDSVKTAFEAMGKTTSGLSKVKERMQPIMDEVSSKFAQSLDAWNALPESERNKSLKPGVTGAPVGVSTGRPGSFDPTLKPISDKPRGGN